MLEHQIELRARLPYITLHLTLRSFKIDVFLPDGPQNRRFVQGFR